MTAVHQSPAQCGEDGILAPVLRAAHKSWIRATTLYLWPVFVQEAPFWERWTAVRYMADEFLRQFRLERAFVDELRPFLPPDTAASLARDGERIGRLQRELDRVGRRRGTAHTVSVLSRRLLQLLRSWCADIEAAAGRIPRGLLPPEGNRLVADLELYASTHV